MKTKTVLKGLCLTFIFALFAPPSVTAQDSEFIPGNDRIIEKDILRRIQEELGTDIAKDKAKSQAMEEEKIEKARRVANQDPTLRSVTLSLKDQSQISGTVVLSQSSVFITPENVAQEVAVPLEEIRTLEFTEWKARRLRVISAPAGRNPNETAAPSENSPEDPGNPDSPENAAENPAPDAGASPEGGNEEAAADRKADSVRIYFLPTKCRVTKSDDTVIDGRCQAMDWLQFNLTGKSTGGFRTFFAQERALPEGGSRELEKSLDSLEAETPVDTVISVELGGFIQQPSSGTAVRAN